MTEDTTNQDIDNMKPKYQALLRLVKSFSFEILIVCQVEIHVG